MQRADAWYVANVPYSQTNWRDGYRTDCSGYVSYCWKTLSNGNPVSYTTANIDSVCTYISKDQLLRGDALLNKTDGHVLLFDHWDNTQHTSYWGYDMANPELGLKHWPIPYAYWSGFDPGNYRPIRYNGIEDVSKPDAHWNHSVIGDRWYRSDEHLGYTIGSGGAANWDAKEWIDGNNTATYHNIGGGYIALSYSSHGWHEYEATCTNSVDSAYTGRWKGGWDPDAPTVDQSEGPQPQKWTNQRNVRWNCADSLSGIRGYRWHFNGDGYSDLIRSTSGSVDLPEGKNTIWVQAEDNTFTGTDETGNRFDKNLGEFWIDITAPAVPTIAFNPPSPGGGSVTITTSSADSASGVDHIEYWINGVKVDSKVGASSTYVWDTSGAPSTNTIHIVAVDAAGNSSSADGSYTVDRAAPVATLSLDPSSPNGANHWYKTKPTATLTATSASGLSGIYYQINGGSWSQYVSPFVVNGSGSVTLRYYAVSNAGVQGPVGETSFLLDATGPAKPILIDEGTVTSSRSTFWFTVQNPDPESGTNYIEYSVGDAATPDKFRAITRVMTKDPIVFADGLFVPNGTSVVFRARVINGAGIASSWSTTDGILADATSSPFAILSWIFPTAVIDQALADVSHSATVGEAIIGPVTDGSTYSLLAGFWSSVTTSHLGGKVQLQDSIGDITKVPFTVEIHLPGATEALATLPAQVDATGHFDLDVPFAGTYDIYVKASHWLKSKVVSFSLGDGDIGTLALINGDVNGDNVVDDLDQAALTAAFRSKPGSPNWNPNADLNGDGVVSASDQAILSKNYKKRGA